MTTSSSNTISVALISSDGEKFEVDLQTVANESESVKNIFVISEEDNRFGKNIAEFYRHPLHIYDVPSKILSKVIDYCKKHGDKTVSDEDLEAFDSEFLKVDNSTLFGLLVAATYMCIKSLMDLTCLTVIDKIDDMTPQEIWKTLDINNDFTHEEVESLYISNPWVFQERKLKKETKSLLPPIEFANLKRKMDKEYFLQKVLPVTSPTEFAYLAPEEKKDWVLVAVLIPHVRQFMRQRLGNRLYPSNKERAMSNLAKKSRQKEIEETEETEETEMVLFGVADLFVE